MRSPDEDPSELKQHLATISEDCGTLRDPDDTPNTKYWKIRSLTPEFDRDKETKNFSKFISIPELQQKKFKDSDAGGPGKPSRFSQMPKDIPGKMPSTSSLSSDKKKSALENSKDHTEKLHNSGVKNVNLDAETNKAKRGYSSSKRIIKNQEEAEPVGPDKRNFTELSTQRALEVAQDPEPKLADDEALSPGRKPKLGLKGLKKIKAASENISTRNRIVGFLKNLGLKIKKSLTNKSEDSFTRTFIKSHSDFQINNFAMNQEQLWKRQKEMKFQLGLLDYVRLWLPFKYSKRTMFNEVRRC